MPTWAVEFYEDDAGCPVQDFLNALEPRKRAKVIAIIAVLEEQGPTLPFPYSSQIEGKLHELRTHYGQDQYRVLYYGAVDRTFVLLHAFVKRTKQTPAGDVKVAKERMNGSVTQKQKRRER